MFTGLVQKLVPVYAVEPDGPGVRLVLAQMPGVAVGDSVAINGCCLTAVAVADDRVTFEAGEETLRCTNLGELQAGAEVNIELALQVGDPLGGHYVSGHVDEVGVIDQRIDDAEWSTIWVKTSEKLTRQMASKASIAIDGVSLTLVDVEPNRFSIALIPHTLSVTTLGQRQIGDRVNLETDILAKYVERQLEWKTGG